ncbi:MAG: BamA/TamA family outer membrane protein [Candidatus Krumholzibacteriia bacterium]
MDTSRSTAVRPAARRRPLRRAGARLLLAAAALVLAAAPRPDARADDELDYGLEEHRLSQVVISGNTTFAEGELKRQLRLQEPNWTRPLDVPTYKPHLVETQLRILRGFYRNRGFHQVAVQLDSIVTVPEKGDVIHISVAEGPRTLIRRVTFGGHEPLTEEQLRRVLTLLEGKPAPADLNAFGGDIYAIRDLYREETYLRASVVPTMTVDPAPAAGGGYRADVHYAIAPGAPFRVRSIRLEGNRQTRDGLLTRELLIHPGDPLRWRQVEDTRRQLLATSLFRDVAVVPVQVDTLTGETDLVVRVIERKPAFYELGVGVGSLERIRVLAAWGHHNLWGTGRRLQVRGRGSWNVEDVVGNPIAFDQGQINYRGDVTYVNPRLWDSRYSFDVNVYVQRETRGESGLNQNTHGLDVGTTWRLGRRITNTVFAGLKITDPDVHPWAPDSLRARFAALGAEVTQTRSLNDAVYVDRRDDVFRPSRGSYLIGALKVAGGPLGGDYSFFKWSAAWHNYRPTPLGGVFALRLMAGGARPYGSSLDLGPEGVPYDDRFFAGGASTVRGYRHNSLGPQVTDPRELDYLNYTSDVLLPDNPARGGNYLLLSNAEWRFPLPVLRRWGLASVLFFEGGNVWAQLSELRLRGFRVWSAPGDPIDPEATKVWDYRWAWGTGLRLDTPFGPVRVDVGFPLKRARYKNLEKDFVDPSAIWHFSLGYPF